MPRDLTGDLDVRLCCRQNFTFLRAGPSKSGTCGDASFDSTSRRMRDVFVSESKRHYRGLLKVTMWRFLKSSLLFVLVSVQFSLQDLHESLASQTMMGIHRQSTPSASFCSCVDLSLKKPHTVPEYCTIRQFGMTYGPLSSILSFVSKAFLHYPFRCRMIYPLPSLPK